MILKHMKYVHCFMDTLYIQSCIKMVKSLVVFGGFHFNSEANNHAIHWIWDKTTSVQWTNTKKMLTFLKNCNQKSIRLFKILTRSMDKWYTKIHTHKLKTKVFFIFKMCFFSFHIKDSWICCPVSNTFDIFYSYSWHWYFEEIKCNHFHFYFWLLIFYFIILFIFNFKLDKNVYFLKEKLFIVLQHLLYFYFVVLIY